MSSLPPPIEQQTPLEDHVQRPSWDMLRSPSVLLTLLGSLMVMGSLLLVRWRDLSGLLSANLPEGFDPSGDAVGQIEQVAVASGAAGSSAPPVWGVIALSMVVLIGLGGVVWVITRRDDEPHRRQVTLLGGLLTLLVVVFWVRSQPNVAVIVLGATTGFWLAVGGMVLLLIQAVFPRASKTREETGTIRVDLSQISGRAGGLPSINIWQNLAVAFQALAANKLRAFLTMLGVIIGVGSIVALLSIGQGAQDTVTSQIENIGTNLITISPIGQSATLVEDDAIAILEGIPGVNAVLPEFSRNVTITAGDSSGTYQVLGVMPDYDDVRVIETQAGRFIDRIDYEDNARIAVVGTTLVEELYDNTNPIGQTITINNQRFEIVGAMEQQDGGFGQDPNARVFVPLSTGYRYLFDARAIASNARRVTSLTVAVENADAVDAATANIEALLRQRHNLAADEDNDFRISNQTQLLETLTDVTSTFTVLLAALAGVSLVVGGIGIMNISLVSVTERTKEIGLRKAVGAKQHHILQQFLIETLVLSVLGGLIGVLVGIGVALLVNTSGVLTASITWDSILLGLGSALITGLFFGVYPASRAASLEPIEALRYE